MNLLISFFAALAILSPKDGVRVPTLKSVQADYLSGLRADRFARMENAAERAKFLAVGSTQQPLCLSWEGPTNAVYELTVAPMGANGDSFALTNLTSVYITNLEIGRKYRWTVRQLTSGESVSAEFETEDRAPRLLRAGGVWNFRDLGGWKTADGCHVREGMILRSAGLRASSKSSGGFFNKKIEMGVQRVTPAGLETLRNEFHIKTDLELRTPQETAGMTGTILGNDVRWECVSFAAYDFIDNAICGREPFAKIFQIFTKAENYPILMHCSGGRDRTGTLAFLLNGLLGVPEDDLCRDWEMSIFNDAGMGFSPDRIQRLLGYLKSFPGNTLSEQIEAYVRSCGISSAEIAAFRKIMLKSGLTHQKAIPPADAE